MEDGTDFLWQGAKAAHMPCCCVSLRGMVQIGKTQLVLTRIRRAHMQKHTTGGKNWVKNDKLQKPWYCKPFQTWLCVHNKDHKVNGKLHKHLCSFCLSQGRYLDHAEKDCIFSRKAITKKKQIKCCPSKDLGMGSSSNENVDSAVREMVNVRKYDKSKTAPRSKWLAVEPGSYQGKALPPHTNSIAVCSTGPIAIPLR